MPAKKKPFWLYIAKCRDGSYYTGIAANVEARIKRHNSGHGARYTASRRPVKLVYSEILSSRSEALKREHQIKRLPRSMKATLVKSARSIRKRS